MTSPSDERAPFVGVGCIIVREDGDVLLMKRHGSHGAGSWSTPGGFLDYGESLAECAAREAKEETGLDVTNVRFYAVTNDIFPDEGKHFVTIWMRADYGGGDPIQSEESTEMEWFPPSRLPEPLFVSLRNLVQEHGLPAAVP